ncbi:MAG TPA: hypothetical protein VHO01_10590 [Jatrophihabitans sp.]|nr:hypothetical protein [Jatrophihabitans sp.]
MIAALVLLAACPILLMLDRVYRSTDLNYADFWSALSRITNPDGSVKLRGFFTYQNEHPFLVPQLLYYLDIKLFHGTNRSLGYYVLLLGIATLALMYRLLPKVWPTTSRVLFLVAASAIVFCPTGAWNYVRGMSGTAWLTANVLSLLAILAMTRGRTVIAVTLAAVALLSYGTGFGAPVALVVIAVLRRDARWKLLLPAGLFVGAGIVYYLTANGGTSGHPSRDPALLIQTFLTNLSTLWDSNGDSTALLLGALGLALAAVAFLRYWPRRAEFTDLVPWWALLAYTLVGAALISVGRSQVFDGNGSQSRYISVTALFWVAVAVLAIRTAPVRLVRRAAIGALVLAVFVFWGASPQIFMTASNESAVQNETAAAMQVGAVDPFRQRVFQIDDQIQRLKNLHAYPFVSSYRIGCGYKPFDTVDLAKVQQLPTTMYPNLISFDTDKTVGSTRQVTGWVYRPGVATTCVLLVDGSGKIVGGGSAHVPRSDVAASNPALPQDAGFDAVAPVSAGTTTILLGFADGLYKLPSNLPDPATAQQPSK